MQRFDGPAANKNDGNNKEITYAIGTHSDEPMSFILFLAIKKENTRINIPNNLGIIFTRKNIKKEIL